MTSNWTILSLGSTFYLAECE